MTVPAFKLPDGINFRTASDLPLVGLSQCLCQVASFLQRIVGHAPLRRFDDWLEHDGLQFQVERAPLDVHGLFGLVGSAQSLDEATPSDEYVYVGVAPLDVGWYLRFRADWDGAGDSLVGQFDITLPHDLAMRFRVEVVADLRCSITEESAATYYKRIVV
jgi:hypothetical protein